MSTISNNNIAQAIYLVSKNKTGDELSASFKNTVKFLTRRRLLSQAPDILLRLEKKINDDKGIITAKISSARKLNRSAKTHLTHYLKKYYSAREVILNENVNEKLIGGLRVEVNNEVIDLTIKNKINKLEEHLRRNV
ncbi:ATP synthase F1 subunit delta [Candidatus Nomurabacteria bacterium RIFCSPLOWO2_01_FULL_40_15]|uniref:ATP synthase subunit delta n=1 Tax=Candidatus Nomurabacteria bacterium RIFCSPLOWO2_01_FULL_40_15 TaxID=1801772 RepID=A0A1F6X609_9BACT|nr:MAG: ATP synthase F1 subunit delta [Candidatus Nomurabacteria bacterium RIFCSPLOWO2_01_FULL_40_15]